MHLGSGQRGKLDGIDTVSYLPERLQLTLPPLIKLKVHVANSSCAYDPVTTEAQLYL